MRVLIACEFSGIVREAFAKRGHDAWSCDLLPTEIPGEKHIQGDVLEILNDGWDLMIAHPPCTYLANSGVQYLHTQENRWELMRNAREFFLLLLNAPINKVCVENPVPHHYADLPRYSQIIQPQTSSLLDMISKHIWLDNLPLLISTNVVDKGKCYIEKDGKSNGNEWYQLLSSNGERWKNRSRTFQGIANAMASQWS